MGGRSDDPLVLVGDGLLISPEGTVFVIDPEARPAIPVSHAVGPGVVSRRLFGFDHTRGGFYQFKTDDVPTGLWFAMHVHGETDAPKDELFIVLSGEIVFVVQEGDCSYELRVCAGQSVLFANGTWHGARNDGEETARVYVLSSLNEGAPEGKGKEVPTAA